jgi:outer membrane protein OmpA-like peptidoglycan-associated protein
MRLYYILFFLFVSISNYSQEKFELFFDFNKDFPNESSEKDFQNWILENATAEITKIEGYCDSVDDKLYNKELSVKRINAILKKLKENNILVNQNVELLPYGKDFNRSKNQNENRKAILYYKIKEPIKIDNTTNQEIPSVANLDLKIEKERASLTSKFKNAKKGDLIRIDNIYFHLDSDKVIEKSKPILLELYSILAKNPNLKIKINGYICCNPDPTELKLSSKRAQSVYTYLVEKEILFFRLSHEGFGSSNPIYKIPEKNDSEKLANRRVEILIVEK